MKSIIARIPIRPDAMDEALAAVGELMAGVGQEPGTLFYTCSIAESDPNMLVFMERYADDAAVAAHSAGSPLNTFVAKGEAFFGGDLDVVVLDEVACI